MMVLFHGFTILTILFPFALGGDNLNCTNKTTVIRPWELCCDGDIYQVANLIWPVESCDVEPKNATLTLADSAWLAYDCNVRKQLNSTALTLSMYSYLMNVMLRVRKPSQSHLWETLKFQSDRSEKIAGEEEYDKIQTIKLYHSESLEALEQACTFGSANSTLFESFNWTSMDFKTRFASIFSYQKCNEEMLPFSGFFATYYKNQVTRGHYDKCKQELVDTLGNVTFYRFRLSIFTLCRAGGAQNLDVKAEITKPTLDLDGIVSNFFPLFWSKWVKNAVRNSVLDGLKQDFKTQDLENMESLMRNKIEERVNNEFSEWGETLANKRGLVQAIMIFSINDVFRATTRNICRIDVNRKENTGV